jgi:transcriptional regulator with PAS, ATPase and Fis domain
VLILGETGTGKEVCAAEIARLSRRKPFIAVNCAAFSEALADSELFGYDRGAFTGAYKDHSGLVAEANGGILFLDELSEIALPVQAKLLRALESGEYRRVGATRTLLSNFRLLAATNGDPDALVGEQKLRADLVYRLGAIRVVLPPLRERLEDIPLLADLFLRRYRDRAGHGPLAVSPDALQLLAEHKWPGNIRQFRNVLEAAAAVAGTSKVICGSHITQVLAPFTAILTPIDPAPTFAEALRRAEVAALVDALGRARGNRARAAEILGISDATLYRKLAKHRLSNISG